MIDIHSMLCNLYNLKVVGNGRRVQMADKSKLPYTEAIILEVLRYSSICKC